MTARAKTGPQALARDIGAMIERVYREAQERAKAGERIFSDERCTCNPDMRLLQPSPGVYIMSYAHDDWCPMVGEKGTP